MNKKYIAIGLVALAMPISALATDASTMRSVARPISTTAAPETNRMVRTHVDTTTREDAVVVAPKAQAYLDRLQVAVEPVSTKSNHVSMIYPEVNSVSPVVEQSINKAIVNYVRGLEKKINTDNLTADNKSNLVVTYDVKANGNGLFSVVIKSYVIQDKAANGLNTAKAFTFNTTSGKEVGLLDFGGLTLAQANEAVAAYGAAHPNALATTYKGLTAVPDEFYATENHEVYMILPQGSVGPMSSGILYVPVPKVEPVTKVKK